MEEENKENPKTQDTNSTPRQTPLTKAITENDATCTPTPISATACSTPSTAVDGNEVKNCLDSIRPQQSPEDTMKLKPASVVKEFPPERALNQILKAQEEQNIITMACVEVDQPAMGAMNELLSNCPSATQCAKSMESLKETCEKVMEAQGANGGGTCSGAVAIGGVGGGSDGGGNSGGVGAAGPSTAAYEVETETTPTGSIRSVGSLVCRICHNSENPERLVSPCLCKGSLTYVHIHCLEHWISTSRNTMCELCRFQYNTEQTLRYSCYQSLRLWYSRSMSRRALQEDCQMFSLLTLIAFAIVGTLLVGVQYYLLQGGFTTINSLWTKGWLLFLLFTTLVVYFMNIYMIVRSQLAPWYRWWQSARDIKLILENRKPFRFNPRRKLQNHRLAQPSTMSLFPQEERQQRHQHASGPFPVAPQGQAPSSPLTSPPASAQHSTTIDVDLMLADLSAAETACKLVLPATTAFIVTATDVVDTQLGGCVCELESSL